VSSLQLTEQRDAFATVLQTLALVFEHEQHQKHTDLLTALDEKRDHLYIGIRHLLRGNSYHFEATKQEAAKRLQLHLLGYGKNVNRMGYQMQTAIISNMLKEWQTQPNLQEAVSLLAMDDWVANLAEVNTTFNKLYVERVTDKVAKEVPSFTSLRTSVTKAYRALIDRIQAFKTLQSGTDYTQLHNEIYELVRQYNLLLKGRRKSAKN
jgi:hypothetical protein